MRWPWNRPEPESGQDHDVSKSPEVIAAREARERSEQELMKIREQRSEVEGVANSITKGIDDLRKKDHLMEIFEQSIRKEPKPNHG